MVRSDAVVECCLKCGSVDLERKEIVFEYPWETEVKIVCHMCGWFCWGDGTGLEKPGKLNVLTGERLDRSNK